MIKVLSAPFTQPRFAQGPIGLFLTEDAGLALHPGLKAQAKKIEALAKAENAKGKSGSLAAVYIGSQKFILSGVGKKSELTAEKLRQAAGRLCSAAEGKASAMAVMLPAGTAFGASKAALAVGEGLQLASYRFLRYKSNGKDEKPTLQKATVLYPAADKKEAEKGLKNAALRSDAVAFVRDLVNDGPSDKRPDVMAEVGNTLAADPNITAQVFDKAQLTEKGMGAILGVARGSLVEPTLVHLAYKPAGEVKKRIALVGKGICFDSGGLSLKPPQSMETMKLDMAGAATVFAVFKALPKLKLPIEVHGFTPFTYNLPGGDAVKPGDILKAYNGKTIEVLNTDAEGRLVLSDALAYAAEMKFDAIIDLATLTGAVLIALGSQVTGAMGNDEALMKALKDAGERAGEKIWELPLVPEYADGIKSKVADLQNISSVRGEAGTIIGGLFLQEFVGKTPWVHLDIAGTAWADRGGAYHQSGGTGALVRTLIEYLEASAS